GYTSPSRITTACGRINWRPGSARARRAEQTPAVCRHDVRARGHRGARPGARARGCCKKSSRLLLNRVSIFCYEHFPSPVLLLFFWFSYAAGGGREEQYLSNRVKVPKKAASDLAAFFVP